MILGKAVDIDKLGLFNAYNNIHSWTSSTIVDGEALVVTRKLTTMVTMEELEQLSTHLGVTLEIDQNKNGRIWASKSRGHITLSNKHFNTISQEGTNNKTICTVEPDVLSFHVQLQNLATLARTIHDDFLAIHDTFPELYLLNETCFQNKSFQKLMELSLSEFQQCINQKKLQNRKPRSILGALIGDSDLINQLNSNMQLAIRTQDENFDRIKHFDQQSWVM